MLRTVLLAVIATVMHACTEVPTYPSARGEQAGEVPAAEETESWPVMIPASTSGETVQLYQPQPESIDGNMLRARAAMVVSSPQGQPRFGTAWFTARLETDRDTRTVRLLDIQVTRVVVPNATSQEEQSLTPMVAQQLANVSLDYSMDQLMASLATAKGTPQSAEKLQVTPPHIYFSATPAVLITINGDPQLRPVDNQPDVQRVINTPFIVLYSSSARRYYVKTGNRYQSAASLTGSWEIDNNVPAAVAAVGEDLAKSEPDQQAAAATQSAATRPEGVPPVPDDAKLIVTTEPSELLVTNGPPQFANLVGGRLSYATNTADNLFKDSGGRYYVLLSGRWYSSTSLAGGWSYVPAGKLPTAFASIPADSPKANVLTFVAGTTQSQEAVLDAGVPQTATIRRTAGADLTVSYDGAPQFRDIPECPGLSYAINTPDAVLQYGNAYYCCHQGVWYVSAQPTGPWAVATWIPEIIYTIPPSCPLYNVTYVQLYGVTPNFVYCGYLPGYTGTYVYGPTIVYGTGYNYIGWAGEAYFPEPCTWGFDAEFDPLFGVWGFYPGIYIGAGWFCHPWHERWWRDHPHELFAWHRWWGPAGFVHYHNIARHFAEARGLDGRAIAGRAGVRPFMPGTPHGLGGWHNLYLRDGNYGRNAFAGRALSPARPVTGVANDLFSDHAGAVYRRMPNGWQMRNGHGWVSAGGVPEARGGYQPTIGRPAPQGPAFVHPDLRFGQPGAGLERDFGARSIGGWRSGAVQHLSGGFHGPVGGFHGGAGGFHGGAGGFRGGGGGGGRR